MRRLEGFEGEVVLGDQMDQLAVEPKERAEETVAQLHGASDDRVEDRLDVGLGLTNDPQDFARGGLLLEGFGNLSMSVSKGEVLFLQLLEQADVLDGDDRLIGEDLHEPDLLVEKRLRLAPIHGDGADDLALTDHRDGEGASDARGPRGLRQLELWIEQDVWDVNEGTRLDGPRGDAAPARRTWEGAPERLRPRCIGVGLGNAVGPAGSVVRAGRLHTVNIRSANGRFIGLESPGLPGPRTVRDRGRIEGANRVLVRIEHSHEVGHDKSGLITLPLPVSDVASCYDRQNPI